jgi:hypothetical protein
MVLTAVVFRFGGNLKDEFFFVASHKEAGGHSAGAEAGRDLEIAREDFADGCLERIWARGIAFR